MGKLVVKRRKTKVPQIGDMRTRIQIFSRKINAPIFGDASFDQLHTLVDTVWSSVETLEGSDIFNETNVKINTTHLFTIRFRNDVNSDNIILLNEENYKILSADNAELRNRFLFCFCQLLGDSNFISNK